jgi:hypothetical protein
MQTTELSVGGSYVARDEKILVPNPYYSNRTDAYAGRINFAHSGYYASAEYNYKMPDAVIEKKEEVKNTFVSRQCLIGEYGVFQERFWNRCNLQTYGKHEFLF